MTKSIKISDILNNNNINLLSYDRADKLQIRINAKAKLINSEEVLLDIWNAMYPMSRECYRVIESPGNEIASLNDIEFQNEDEEGINGFDNFSAILCDISSIEILYLHHAGHLRANYKNNNGKLDGKWIVP